MGVADSENNEILPKVWIFIYNDEEKIITKIKAKNKAGINRITWNLTRSKHYNQTRKFKQEPLEEFWCHLEIIMLKYLNKSMENLSQYLIERRLKLAH